MSDSYDVIVLGVGAMGSATVYELARRGLRVLGVDQYPPGHTRGSSHGDSRIIRQLYYEGALYGPLLRRAYQRWDELEQASGTRVLHVTGGLMLGVGDGHVVSGSRQTATRLGLPYDDLSAAEIHRRFPAFHPPEHFEGIWDPRAGYLRPDAAIAAFLALATRHGAQFDIGESAATWAPDGAGVAVTTTTRRYRADRLVLSAGAWITRLVPELRLPIVPERQVLVWFDPPATPDAFAVDVCPIYICEHRSGHAVYGFPRLVTGVKASIFGEGERIADPDGDRRPVDPGEIRRLRDCLAPFIPAFEAAPVRASITCLFTNTPDTRFVIDYHPAYPQVVICSPCSGHGFKFASAIGEANADLATGTPSGTDLSPFRVTRFDSAGAGGLDASVAPSPS